LRTALSHRFEEVLLAEARLAAALMRARRASSARADVERHRGELRAAGRRFAELGGHGACDDQDIDAAARAARERLQRDRLRGGGCGCAPCLADRRRQRAAA